MICPHCAIGTSPNWQNLSINAHRKQRVQFLYGNCTECRGLIARGVFYTDTSTGDYVEADLLFFPARQPPRPTPPHVDEPYATDFQEAATVLADSPKASAALSRRLVQRLLREKGAFTGLRDLNAEIDAAIASNTMSAPLADDLDALRTIGNFAAHPIKAEHTGEVVDVEEGEATWLLDLLDDLLQHYFTGPAIRARRRAAANVKLEQAGKQPLKGTPEVSSGDEPEAPPTF